MLLNNRMGHDPSASLDKAPERLCRFRLCAIGDCCHTVPVVRTLQAVWLPTQLPWVIGRTEAALLGHLDGVEFIIFDKRAGRSGRGAPHAQLNGRQFAILLLMQVAWCAGLAARAVRARPGAWVLIATAVRICTDCSSIVAFRPTRRPTSWMVFFDFLRALLETVTEQRLSLPREG